MASFIDRLYAFLKPATPSAHVNQVIFPIEEGSITFMGAVNVAIGPASDGDPYAMAPTHSATVEHFAVTIWAR